ncbi:MAG TPA: tripartite tricarboxylate transporter substrate binding protein [Pseudolabrys sp.]|nr:tripartite tricarboxylate transporter substrate binding protein [Pseudolabrys sp.]
MKRVLSLLAAVIALGTMPAFAEDYPSRPIHVLTTSSAGGISDIFMRVLGDALRPSINNQPLIIENRPGGAGNIAARVCTEAAPDGYTICIINADTVVYNQYMFKKLPFEPRKLTPIVNLFHLIQLLVINSDLKAKTVDDLIATSKAKAGTLSYLTASIPMVVYMESLKKDKGADWVRVPFRGGGEATSAVLSGSTPIALIGLANVISQIKAGKMTALAMINNIRSPQLPDVPTLADTGYKGAPSSTWYGLFAPAGTPKAIIDKLNAEIVRVVSDKAFQEKYIIARSLVPALNKPEEFAAEIKAESAVAKDVVKASGLPRL